MEQRAILHFNLLDLLFNQNAHTQHFALYLVNTFFIQKETLNNINLDAFAYLLVVGANADLFMHKPPSFIMKNRRQNTTIQQLNMTLFWYGLVF